MHRAVGGIDRRALQAAQDVYDREETATKAACPPLLLVKRASPARSQEVKSANALNGAAKGAGKAGAHKGGKGAAPQTWGGGSRRESWDAQKSRDAWPKREWEDKRRPLTPPRAEKRQR